MTIHDHLWPFMTIHANSWQLKIIHDLKWQFMTIHDVSWNVVTSHANSWQIMRVQDIFWPFATIHEDWWQFIMDLFQYFLCILILVELIITKFNILPCCWHYQQKGCDKFWGFKLLVQRRRSKLFLSYL